MLLGFSVLPWPLSPAKRGTDGTGGSIKAAAGKSVLVAELNFRKSSLLIPATVGQSCFLFKNMLKDVSKNSFVAGRKVNWLPIY